MIDNNTINLDYVELNKIIFREWVHKYYFQYKSIIFKIIDYENINSIFSDYLEEISYDTMNRVLYITTKRGLDNFSYHIYDKNHYFRYITS